MILRSGHCFGRLPCIFHVKPIEEPNVTPATDPLARLLFLNLYSTSRLLLFFFWNHQNLNFSVLLHAAHKCPQMSQRVGNTFSRACASWEKQCEKYQENWILGSSQQLVTWEHTLFLRFSLFFKKKKIHFFLWVWTIYLTWRGGLVVKLEPKWPGDLLPLCFSICMSVWKMYVPNSLSTTWSLLRSEQKISRRKIISKIITYCLDIFFFF